MEHCAFFGRCLPYFQNPAEVKRHVFIGPYLPFSEFDGVKRYVFTGLYLLCINFGWGGPLCLCWTVPPLLGFGWGGTLRFHWSVPLFLPSSSNDFLFVVHLGFIIVQKKEFVKRKNKKI